MKKLFAIAVLIASGFTSASSRVEAPVAPFCPLGVCSVTPAADVSRYLVSQRDTGQCMGNCAAEQGQCMGQCRGDAQCLGYCAASHGRCVARCH